MGNAGSDAQFDLLDAPAAEGWNRRYRTTDSHKMVMQMSMHYKFGEYGQEGREGGQSGLETAQRRPVSQSEASDTSGEFRVVQTLLTHRRVSRIQCPSTSTTQIGNLSCTRKPHKLQSSAPQQKKLITFLALNVLSIIENTW